MASSDFDVQSAGGTVTVTTVLHSAVPDQQLNHDTNTLSVTATAESRYYLRFINETIPSTTRSMSIRVAAAINRSNAGTTSFGMALKINTAINGDFLSPNFSFNGIELIWSDDYMLKLYADRAIKFTTQLSGVVDAYKWLHFRMDFLLQDNNERGIIDIYTSDLKENSVIIPSWIKLNQNNIFLPKAVIQNGLFEVAIGGTTTNGTDKDVFADYLQILI